MAMNSKIEKLYDLFDIKKGIYAYEYLGETDNGDYSFGDAKFFTDYASYSKSRDTYYSLNVKNREDFENYKEYPDFNFTKQVLLLQVASEQLVGTISVRGTTISYEHNGLAVVTENDFATSLARLLVEPFIFEELTDKELIKSILKEG